MFGFILFVSVGFFLKTFEIFLLFLYIISYIYIAIHKKKNRGGFQNGDKASMVIMPPTVPQLLKGYLSKSLSLSLSLSLFLSLSLYIYIDICVFLFYFIYLFIYLFLF